MKLKTFFRLVVAVLLLPFFHYLLPQHDIARITSTEIIRQDFSGFNRLFYAQADSGSAEQTTRDLRLINTVRQQTYLLGFIRGGDDTMVFRNEDTGWIWPPYFKFDSSDLQAEAADYAKATDQYYLITHYGWRNRVFSIYPNAISIKPIEDPNMRIIPWFNIAFFIALMAGILFVRAAWFQFRERSLDPAMDRVGHKWDEVEAGVAKRKSRLGRWMDSWKSK
ncbi:hypothetical protein BVC71_10050 [Marivivens niveibacter]|uniref:DUF1523 domain-containing protein n=1 Tax=Marivivens niveibacter TaxID=1930667 RepID=A0A251WXH5_9RHOB|nr:DUF1523 family protein [Marivivens niveibacter]OUD09046.1 hypothetical protein BVC71_10050 [Marivivens niveibacter]